MGKGSNIKEKSRWKAEEGPELSDKENIFQYEEDTPYYNEQPLPPRNQIEYGSKEQEERLIRDNSLTGIKIFIVFLLIFMIVAAVFLVPFFSGIRGYPEEAEFELRRDITLTTSGVLSYVMDFPVPTDIENGIQEVESVVAEPEPEYIEKYGQDWMEWEGEFGSEEDEDVSKTFSLTYNVSTKTVEWDHSSDNSGTVNDVDEELRETYLGDHWELKDRNGENIDRNDDGRYDIMIEPSHPLLEDKAEEIVEDADNIYEKSEKLYDWLDDNIEYRRGTIEGDGRPQHAIWTFDERAGDCDEQSFLYISMARAVGIPAYIELGVLYDRVREDWGGHGWVRQKFVDAEGESEWVNIDPVNDQFFARDALRITSWVDDGKETENRTHLEDFYTFLSYSGPLEDWSEEFETLNMEERGRVRLLIDEFIVGDNAVWERTKIIYKSEI